MNEWVMKVYWDVDVEEWDLKWTLEVLKADILFPLKSEQLFWP